MKQMRAEAKKRSEEEEMMRLQPVTTDQAKVRPSPPPMPFLFAHLTCT
jgi:hypothetical protein